MSPDRLVFMFGPNCFLIINGPEFDDNHMEYEPLIRALEKLIDVIFEIMLIEYEWT